MTVSEVIDKLTRDCCFELGSFDNYTTIHTAIQRALVIGLEHFREDQAEIMALDQFGVEVGHFKSVVEASEKLGICRQSIVKVLNNRANTAGGLHFVKVNDPKLIKKKLDDFLKENP
jgi:hypothetical protein